MADFPEYKRRSPIQPSSSGGNIEGTFGRAASAMQTGTQKTFGETVGQQVAQNAANQLARNAGAELGKTPGLKTPTIMPLGESGAHLAKAYQAAELQTVQFEATKSLQKVYGLAVQVGAPDSQTLADYETWGLKAIQDNVALLPAERQGAVQHSLMQIYSTGFDRLSKRVMKANALKMQDETNMAFSQQMELSTEAYLSGDTKQGDYYAETARSILEKGQAHGILTQPEAHKRFEMLTRDGQQSRMNGQVIEAAKEGKGDAYISSLRAKGLPAPLLASAEETLLEYEAEEGIAEYELSNELLSQSADGSLTEEEALEGEDSVSDKTRAQIVGNIGKLRKKQIQGAFAQIYIAKNHDNAIALSSMKPSQIDAFTEKLWDRAAQQQGGDLNFEQKARAIENLKAPNSVLVGQLNAALTSLEPQSVLGASNAVAYLSEVNPLAIDGLPKRQMDMALDVTTAVKYGADPERAVEVATGRMAGVSREVAHERLKRLPAAMRAWNGAGLMKAQTARVLDINRSQITTELEMATYNAVVGGYLEKEDMPTAEAIGKATINKTFGKSNALGGAPKFMRSPPNKWVENGDAIARHQVLYSAVQLAAAWDALNAKGKGSGFKYEVEAPSDRNWIAEMFSDPQPIKIKQIFDEPYPKVIEGTLVIESDTATINPGEPGMPSYGIYIETKDGKKALLNTNLRPIRYRLRDQKLFEEERATLEKSLPALIEQGKKQRATRNARFESLLEGYGGLSS